MFSQDPDFFKTLCDNMEIGVAVTDPAGLLTYINPAYARFIEVDPEKHIGRHISEFVPNSRLQVVAESGQAEINWPHEFKGGSILVHRVPIKREGKVVAALALVLFTSAETINRLAEKLTVLQSKLKLYEEEIISLRSTRYTIDNMIGDSKGMQIVKQEVRKAVSNQLPVLVTGESGTGKELVAQAIHDGSVRRLYPFVRVNCAAIPKELFESELFGYEKGSFTGASSKGKVGKFELAHMGTIFLDEIGDLPLELQPKLLRVLELKEFERVGGNRLIRSDFRLIAATNRDLRQMVDDGGFRLDLYFRLNVIPISIPPLRARRDDILPLAEHFLKKNKALLDQKKPGDVRIGKEAARALLDYDWPGNSRELVNVIERALAGMEGNIIQADDLPYYIQNVENKSKGKLTTSLKDYLQEAEKKAIREVLGLYGGNRNLAAKSLGIHRTLLYKKMKKLDIVYGGSV